MRWLLLCLFAGNAFAQAATTAGTVTTPHPTTQAISIEWAITGDANTNGVVSVEYRKQGTATWRSGMALIRVPAGFNNSGDFGGGNPWSNKHSGSLFDLDSGTTYEIKLTLHDADGGDDTRTLTATTRAIPVAAPDAVVKNVTVANFASMLAGAVPGDVLLLSAGNYPTFTLEKSGTAGHPIVIRGATAASVTINGRATMNDLEWVHLERVTVMGEVRMKGTSNSVVRECLIRTMAGGIYFPFGQSVPHDNYIVDNDIVGGAVWVNDQLSVDGYNGGEGIEFSGPGHVICFNHVKGFRDDISFFEYGEAFDQTSIDICNNDLEEATDDAVEADSAMGNVRVLRNRVRNAFDGLSSQPNLGGPTYFIGNTMFNVLYSPFKFHNGTIGDIVLHNTVVKCGDAFGCYAGRTWGRAYFRNNLFIGGEGGGTYGGYGNGTGRIFALADADSSCSFDYDGLGSIGIAAFEGRIGGTTFTSLASLQATTTEVHAVKVDLSVFASTFAFPSNPFPPKAVVDLQLASGGAAIDKAIRIVGVNDQFTGAAPDLGALEFGVMPPVYGPRMGGVGPMPDAGTAFDGGTSSDAGPSADAGVTDAGVVVPPNDAGTVSNSDGGTGDSTPVTGCNCNVSGGGTLAMALALIVARRARAI